MYCPFKMANPGLTPHYLPEAGYESDRDWQCEKDQCEFWIDRFGRCALAVDAHLKAHKDYRAERGMRD